MKPENWRAIWGMFLGVFGVVVAPGGPVSATPIAYTGFENETWYDLQYFDTGNPAVDHDLVNNPNEPIMDSTLAGSGAAGDLGFNSRYVNTRNSVGLTDGDNVGVTQSLAFNVGAWTDGVQGFRSNDTDGMLVVEFDAVPIIGTTMFEIDYFINATDWEANDVFSIFLTIDGSTTVSIINTTGLDIDDLGIEGGWATGSADLTGLGASAVLSVLIDTDSVNEMLAIDRVTFIPEPASLVLLGIGGLALLHHRRSRRPTDVA